jgi:short-subunit dehydrogenase
MTRVLLVGATDGIGLELAKEYLRVGSIVGIVGRSAERTESVRNGLAEEFEAKLVHTSVCDVKDRSRSQLSFGEITDEMEGIDLLVFCAGIFHAEKPPRTADARSLNAENDLDTFDVNLMGAVSWVAAAVNLFLKQGSGHVALLGSIAGDRGRPGNPSYCASKAAIEAYLEGVRARLHSAGIAVSTVKPGFVKTKMLGGKDAPGAIEPDDAARRIKRGLDRRRDVFYVPHWWGLVGLAMKLIPGPLFKRIAPQ